MIYSLENSLTAPINHSTQKPRKHCFVLMFNCKLGVYSFIGCAKGI